MYNVIRKYFLFLFFLIAGFVAGFCQQEPRSSFYMLNSAAFNPGYVGSKDQADIILNFKQPYGSFNDGAGNKISPHSFWTTANMPLKKINSGFGLNYYTDKNGQFETNSSINGQYAYHFNLGEGKLGLGINLGLNMLKYDFQGIVLPGDISNSGQGSSDVIIESLKNKKSFNLINVGLGGYYKIGELYFGTSFTNINSPKLKLDNSDLKYYVPNVYFLAGYTYNTTNPLLVIRPSLLYKTPINGMVTTVGAQLSLSSLIEYNKFIQFGLEYSTGNDVSIIIGATLKNGTKFEGARIYASYDIITSKLGSLSMGKFEFLFGYSFKLQIEKNTKTYKSVRFL